MKIVIQRVKEASVVVEGKTTGSINQGLLVLLGVGNEDTKEMVDKYVDKLVKLRIFADSKGNRPSFVNAGSPELGNELYEYFCHKVKEKMGSVQVGEFGADMKVSLINDGPFTIVWDSRDW